MKKMFYTALACLALEAGAVIAWSFYLDILAAFLFAFAVLPSCMFATAHSEWRAQRALIRKNKAG